MVDLIRRLAATHAILLVEHDMDAVFQLAEVLTVMVDGKVPCYRRAGGQSAPIAKCRDAYLGSSDEDWHDQRADHRSARAAHLLRR